MCQIVWILCTVVFISTRLYHFCYRNLCKLRGDLIFNIYTNSWNGYYKNKLTWKNVRIDIKMKHSNRRMVQIRWRSVFEVHSVFAIKINRIKNMQWENMWIKKRIVLISMNRFIKIGIFRKFGTLQRLYILWMSNIKLLKMVPIICDHLSLLVYRHHTGRVRIRETKWLNQFPTDFGRFAQANGDKFQKIEDRIKIQNVQKKVDPTKMTVRLTKSKR